ncbi:uncharacterized protein LOC17877760 [Capsella rubella]|uniref:uncharacterized protein LOC17877760 n=1 Tax=Capsella rubella TaxID=81985 RepID=UPI000CD5A5CA|nr:uncharacterized protein LOC17877760 [Capsella rubella]
MGDYLLIPVIIGIIFAFSSLVSSDELLVVGETEELLVNTNFVVKVKGSPRQNQDLPTLCERIHIYGRQRLKHIDKYAHSLNVIVNVSTGDNTSTTHVCFHRNLSLAIGMCPHNQWEKVSNGSWTQTMSPFDQKILSVRTTGSSKATLKVSIVEELCMMNIVFLILGSILLSSASTLSRSVAFYYTCVMSIGIVLAVLLLFFQGLKRLPTGRNSSALFLYSFVVVGLVGVFFRCITELFQSMEILVGFDEGNPELMALCLWLHLYLSGLIFGLHAVKRLALTKDGSIDLTTSVFVSWSIWISAAVLILQSTMDPLLGGGALISVIFMSSMLKKSTRLMTFLGRVHEIMTKLLQGIWEKIRDVAGPMVPVSICEMLRKIHFEPTLRARSDRNVTVQKSGHNNVKVVICDETICFQEKIIRAL